MSEPLGTPSLRAAPPANRQALTVPDVSQREAIKIIAGFDGSPASHDALRLAGELAHAEGAELEVAVALERFAVPIQGEAYEQALAQDFEELFGEAARRLPGMEITRRELRMHRELLSQSAARALAELAEAEGADLVVLGSTHRGAIGRVFPGSVGERLLNGSPCAIAVAPRGYAEGEHPGVGLVGVGYDGSEESGLALRTAAQLSWRLGAKLRLIAAARPLELLPGRPGPTGAAFRQYLEHNLHSALDEAVSSLPYGTDVETRIEQGEPAAVLADQGVDLDLLVIGSRGYGPIRRTLLGGVSATVIRTAPCPVVVVPRGSATAGGEHWKVASEPAQGHGVPR
jgi:nucleotide-binding universal stress UspA family protein